MCFYRLLDQINAPGRCYLGDPLISPEEIVDARTFTSAQRYFGPNIQEIEVLEAGEPLDFTLAAHEMPVLSERGLAVFTEFGGSDFEAIPATVYGRKCHILNVLRIVDGIDRERSEIQYWNEGDGVPHMVGRIFGISKLYVKKEALEDTDIARLADWEHVLVISEALAVALRKSDITGCVLEQIT